MIDLRSDTVTKPTRAMRAAMANAHVGDDVFGEDPTVNALEERAAELCGKEAGLFVPSGTMANLVAMLVHVPRGGEILADEDSHVVLNEAAGYAFVAGASLRTIRTGIDAVFRPVVLANAVRDARNLHHPRTSLLMLENTHAHRMGRPLTVDYTVRVATWAHRRGIPVHVDGARILNAAVALGTTAATLLAPVDSASICLSKGLGAPAGSVVVGTHGFIEEARRARKALGGGQRQIGILAAAGLVALRPGPRGMIDRLAKDHERARVLAERMADVPGIALDPDRVKTNIVIFEIASARTKRLKRDMVLKRLAADGILMYPYPKAQIRAVVHYGIDDDDLHRVVASLHRATEG